MLPPANQQVQWLSSPATGFKGRLLGKSTTEFKNSFYDPFCQAQPDPANNGSGISQLYMHTPRYGTAPSVPPSDPKKHRSIKAGGKSSNISIDKLEDEDDNDLFLSFSLNLTCF
jgi:hypothetical protein